MDDRLKAEVHRRLRGLTPREFWQGCQYLGIPQDEAEQVWRDAQTTAATGEGDER